MASIHNSATSQICLADLAAVALATEGDMDVCDRNVQASSVVCYVIDQEIRAPACPRGCYWVRCTESPTTCGCRTCWLLDDSHFCLWHDKARH
eukprot:2105749-Amphidinium_carterae.2